MSNHLVVRVIQPVFADVRGGARWLDALESGRSGHGGDRRSRGVRDFLYLPARAVIDVFDRRPFGIHRPSQLAVGIVEIGCLGVRSRSGDERVLWAAWLRDVPGRHAICITDLLDQTTDPVVSVFRDRVGRVNRLGQPARRVI
ncbi:hypothetical protein D3C85_476670 [compost metagenome]